jgi:hypothetical protein
MSGRGTSAVGPKPAVISALSSGLLYLKGLNRSRGRWLRQATAAKRLAALGLQGSIKPAGRTAGRRGLRHYIGRRLASLITSSQGQCASARHSAAGQPLAAG